ncbi:DUF1259 domain-containing protein [Streptomyces chiangmaiensis]|uniref:DUF1259 domain-containing protein n=1 Tax=Streptomyces chiangmaiensis TaxID=766497 RepID=A0ABU7FS65_9ACTN|nr:DUF1259 domain-containing protein [Streptomyces chiangmaiensis]MED7826834.1 DUF1259 domain-containing protein [Streptomyces chiangmaiensis]
MPRIWRSLKPVTLALALLTTYTLMTASSGFSGVSAAVGTPQASISDRGTDLAPRAEAPLPTTGSDWKPVADTLGRTGSVMGGTVYHVALPRKDLKVTSKGVAIKPGFALGGYVNFAKYRNVTIMMGDLVVTEDELQRVTDALQKVDIEQTGIHKHLLQQSPAIWWTHVHGMGDPVTLARGLKEALAATSIPAASPTMPAQPRIDLDTTAIDNAMGRKGTVDGGIYKFSIPRRDTVTDGQHILPPALGITTAVNFQPLGDRRAAINGDFVMTADEVNKVIRALRSGGIDVVELHNHMLNDQPRLFYLHYWATGDGTRLAKAIRPALDVTDLSQPTI